MESENYDMESVDSERYLGDIISNDDNKTKNICTRRKKGIGVDNHFWGFWTTKVDEDMLSKVLYCQEFSSLYTPWSWGGVFEHKAIVKLYWADKCNVTKRKLCYFFYLLKIMFGHNQEK